MEDDLDADEPGDFELQNDEPDLAETHDNIADTDLTDTEVADADNTDAELTDTGFTTDVEGTSTPVTKVRPDASIFDGGEGGRNKIIALIIGIVAVSALAGVFIARSAEDTQLQLVEGSVQESLTADCFWTITYEVENRSDDTVVMIDTKVFTGNGDLAVTQAARDIVLEAGQRTPNLIQYYVDNCPADPADIDHGSLDIINTSLGGAQRTTRLEF